MKLKKYFYFEQANLWDKISVITYLILSVILYFDPYGIISKEIVLGYSIGTQLFLYFFNYKSLRKLNIWLIWFLYALMHLYLYEDLILKDDFQHHKVPAASFLKHTWISLLLFQFLRILSLVIQNKELVPPTPVGQTDLWEDRKLTAIDYICFIIFFVFIFIIIPFTSF